VGELDSLGIIAPVMDSTTTKDKMTDCLDQIESLFLSESYNMQADYIAGLRRLYRSVMIADREEFERLVTDGYLWLGMGTIADISFASKDAGQRFVRAYYDFASECERLGLGSTHSRKLMSVFGEWIR
jgi:hypothetical protein